MSRKCFESKLKGQLLRGSEEDEEGEEKWNGIEHVWKLLSVHLIEDMPYQLKYQGIQIFLLDISVAKSWQD